MTIGHVQVAVVGAGPVGATVANLLGGFGVQTLLIDREPGIIDYPRAIGLDDESVRSFQSIGLAEEVLGDAIQNVPLKFFDATGRCFADVRPGTREYGWFRRNIFMQPLAEATLRRGLGRFPNVTTLLDTELERLEQDSRGVTLQLTSSNGESRAVRADYVVAADGGRSTIRTQLGIGLDGTTHERKWVVIDCVNDPLDAPFTGLHCDPRRPYVCAHLPYNRRRWEFMLFPGEDAEQMLSPATVRELLSHHLDNPDIVEIVRARVYTHHSRIATRFVQGRVALVGDAAHLMPPWAGQGMNTGIRDATNLAWKLATIVHGQAAPTLLDTYEQERRRHAQAMIDLSTTLGRILSPTHRSAARARDLFFRIATLAPAVRSWIVEMRFKAQPFYAQGFVAPEHDSSSAPSVGRMFIQPMVEDVAKRQVKLDDVLANWFAVVGFECDPLAKLDAADHSALKRLRPRIVKIVKSRAGDVRGQRPNVCPGTVVVEDAENLLRPWFQARERDVVILRPDRYIAALTTGQNCGRALRALTAQLGCGSIR